VSASTPLGTPPERRARSAERPIDASLDARRSTLGARSRLRRRLVWLAVFLAAAAPGIWLAYNFWLAWNFRSSALGKDPVEGLEHATGEWAIRFLALTLAITPVRQLTGWNAIAPYRRMLGLFAFWYATAHLAVFAGLDLELQLGEVAGEIVKRPYITIGFAAWLLLVPLAITSTKGWIRRLGGRRWNRLHKATYAVAVLALVHYLWSQKKDVSDPLLFAALFAALFAWRGWRAWRRRTA
jgi:sulfoxide reductase heme-binding subunit YedZ